MKVLAAVGVEILADGRLYYRKTGQANMKDSSCFQLICIQVLYSANVI
jgi:hypothetical protein